MGFLKGEALSRGMKRRKPLRMSFLSRLKMNFESIISSLNAPNYVDTVTPFHPVRDIFKGEMVTYRMNPIPLKEFKRISRVTRSTINDIDCCTCKRHKEILPVYRSQ